MAEEEKTKDKKVNVPAKFKDLVEKIESLSALDLSELVKVLEDKFGVSAAAPVAIAAAPSAGDSEDAVEEKSTFTVELKGAGSEKIQVIKVVRDALGLGLKEAKDVVDAAPKVLKEGIKKEEADELKKKLEGAGATVELK